MKHAITLRVALTLYALVMFIAAGRAICAVVGCLLIAMAWGDKIHEIFSLPTNAKSENHSTSPSETKIAESESLQK